MNFKKNFAVATCHFAFRHRLKLTVIFVASLAFILSGECFFSNAAEPSPEGQNDSGQALAQELRSLQPEKNSEIDGLLRIRSKDKKITEIPVSSKVVVGTNCWDFIYQTTSTNQTGAERLVIRHFADAPNEYFYARAEIRSAGLPEPKKLSSGDATVPFAGSDFSLADLGLDFLHWPEQRQLKGEMRLGQPCYVLESSNPEAKDIVRVKSWIDKASNGILIAEAYNRKKELVKEFSLSGSSFKKINGQWRLEKMEIRNAKAGTQTVLKFNLPK